MIDHEIVLHLFKLVGIGKHKARQRTVYGTVYRSVHKTSWHFPFCDDPYTGNALQYPMASRRQFRPCGHTWWHLPGRKDRRWSYKVQQPPIPCHRTRSPPHSDKAPRKNCPAEILPSLCPAYREIEPLPDICPQIEDHPAYLSICVKPGPLLQLTCLPGWLPRLHCFYNLPAHMITVIGDLVHQQIRCRM